MRIFENLYEAYREINRDLAKSPVVNSSRVQQLTVDVDARESMNYTYCIRTLPESPGEFATQAADLGVIDSSLKSDYAAWLSAESNLRMNWHPGISAELLNPHLASVYEGREPSYVYGDRLALAVQGITDQLYQTPDTRRAYWPIFIPEDAIRAARQTRIPCSLGYWFALRELGDGTPYLHMTYLQRSCDFRRFWYWDVALASLFQLEILDTYNQSIAGTERREAKMGPLTHTILSLHMFIEEGEEIY